MAWLLGTALLAGLASVALPSPAAAATALPVPTVGMVTDITWGISRANMQRTVDTLTASGVRSVRLNISWSGVERDAKGSFNTGWLAEIDAAVTMARSAGLEVLMPIADGVPYWASADPRKAGGTWNKLWRPTLMSDYGDFVGFVVRRYSPMGVSTYEIWNEPNHPHFWPSGVNAAAYVEMLRAGSAAVRAANPAAKVVMGGLTKSDHSYMAALYAAGARPYFDIAAIHPYTGAVAPTLCWNDSTGKKAMDAFCGIEAVRDVMVANGDSAKALWLTELGWSTTTGPYGVNEVLQATYLTDAFTWLSARPYVTRAFWYGFRNTYWLNDDPAQWEANTGVLRTDFSPKLAHTALRAVTALQAVGDTITAPIIPDVPAPASRFTPLTPARILDTRSGTGAPAAPLGPNGVVDLQVTGRGGVPADVSAVVLNVTSVALSGSASSFLTAWPTGGARPEASNLNYVTGEVVPNLVTVKVGAGGKVSLFNAAGSVHVLADVAGYYAPLAESAFTPLKPTRLLDTRTGNGAPAATVGPGGIVGLQVTGRGGVPAGATGVVLNVTAVGLSGSASSYITAWPAGSSLPQASNLNLVVGQIVPNLVVAKIGTGGKVNLRNQAGQVHLLADVAGYYGATGSTFTPVAPARILDTRTGNGAPAVRIPAGGTIDLQVTGRGGVATTASAVVLNVTAVSLSGSGSSWLTAWPTGQAMPATSNLNMVAGEVVPNAVVAMVGTGGKVTISNNSGNVDVLADVAGYVGG